MGLTSVRERLVSTLYGSHKLVKGWSMAEVSKWLGCHELVDCKFENLRSMVMEEESHIEWIISNFIKTTWDTTLEVWIWIRVVNFTIDILSDVAKSKELPPSISIDIVENKSTALISLIATNDSWWKNSTILLDIFESDIGHEDEWLGLTSTEWVKHAPWSSTIWLLLLLWSNVD